MDDDEGWWTWTVNFEPSGAIFSGRCPSCGARMKNETFKARQNWLTEMVEAKAECKRCGPVEPVHLGWASDYEAA